MPAIYAREALVKERKEALAGLGRYFRDFQGNRHWHRYDILYRTRAYTEEPVRTEKHMKDAALRIREIVERTERTMLQNILMRIPDKVCATALAALPDESRTSMYALIADSKAHRIREEIRLESRRRTSAAVRDRLMRSFLSYFDMDAQRGPRVWIRPLRRRNE